MTLPRSTLFTHIAHVVRLRPKEQMGGVHTGGVVATVEDVKPLWYGADGKLPRKAMDANYPTMTTGSHDPIAVTYGPGPYPALTRLIDARPEPLLNGNHSGGGLACGRAIAIGVRLAPSVPSGEWRAAQFAGMMEGHRSLSFGVTSGAVSAAPRLSYAFNNSRREV